MVDVPCVDSLAVDAENGIPCESITFRVVHNLAQLCLCHSCNGSSPGLGS